jgi:hypothetical protein
MTGQLWRACEREAARTGRRTTRAFARAERDQQQAAEQQIRDAAKETVAEAERILRERDRS